MNRVSALAAVFVSASLFAGNNPVQSRTYEEELPVVKRLVKATDLLEFNAISDGKKVYVNWASGNQQQYDYFTVEKAKDGIHFEMASMVKGAGHSEKPIDYIDIDYSPYSGISFYRLKQTDYSGKESYSDVIQVNYQFSKDGTVISCQGFDVIEMKEAEKKEILVVLRDSNGAEFVSKVIINDTSGEVYASDPKSKLSKGIYTVVASSYNRLYSRNLIIQ